MDRTTTVQSVDHTTTVPVTSFSGYFMDLYGDRSDSSSIGLITGIAVTIICLLLGLFVAVVLLIIMRLVLKMIKNASYQYIIIIIIGPVTMLLINQVLLIDLNYKLYSNSENKRLNIGK